ECERLIDELELQFVVLAATDLPFLIVPELLRLVAEQDKREQASVTANVVREVLTERDVAVLSDLGANPELPKKYLRIVAAALAADWESRAGSPVAEERLRLTESGRIHFLHLRERRLGELHRDAARLADRLAAAVREKEDLARL